MSRVSLLIIRFSLLAKFSVLCFSDKLPVSYYWLYLPVRFSVSGQWLRCNFLLSVLSNNQSPEPHSPELALFLASPSLISCGLQQGQRRYLQKWYYILAPWSGSALKIPVRQRSLLASYLSGIVPQILLPLLSWHHKLPLQPTSTAERPKYSPLSPCLGARYEPEGGITEHLRPDGF